MRFFARIARPLSILTLTITMWPLAINTATASARDDECFLWYRYHEAVPGEPSCKARALAAAANCDVGNSVGCHDPERLQRFCDEPIRRVPANCRSGSHDVGNPIDSSTGNKHLVERDYSGTGLFPLVFERYYNSMSVMRAGGEAWRSSYSQSLQLIYPAEGAFPYLVYVTRPDGRTIHYRRGNTGWITDWIADADSADRLRELKEPGGIWTAGWEWTNSDDDSVEHYNREGRLIRITSRHGQSQTMTWGYDNLSYVLIRVTDHFGRQLNFSYQRGRLATMTDPAGNVHNYTQTAFPYYGRGRLGSVTYPSAEDGQPKRTYLYNEAEHTNGTEAKDSLLTGIVDERGIRIATYDYDAKERGIGTQHADGVNKYVVEYGSNQTIVTDPLNSVRTYRFSRVLGAARLAGVDQPAGEGCAAAAGDVQYDGNGNVILRKDFNGTATTYRYDLARNLETSRTEAVGMPEARTVTTDWHPTHRRPLRIAEPKRLTTFAYFENGNVQTKSVQATNDLDGAAGFAAHTIGEAQTWRYTYNSAGQLLGEIGPRTDVTEKTAYAYDAQGNLISITNALGHVRRFSNYDAHGRVGTIREPSGLTVNMTYTARGWLATYAETAGGVTRTTRYDYDAGGYLKQVSYADGSKLAYRYDDAGRLVELTDVMGNSVRYELDAMGNRIVESVADASGNLARKVARVHDELNRVKAISGGNL